MVGSDDMAGQLPAGEVEPLPFLETIHVALFLEPHGLEPRSRGSRRYDGRAGRRAMPGTEIRTLA